jgi:hypothetical protein
LAFGTDARAGADSTVLASVFGGSGAISALGAVYAMATQGIRDATLDHARVRVVLTAFATQIGQLRAIIERPPGSEKQTIDQLIAHASKLNESIETSMGAAIKGIPSPVQIAAKTDKADALNGARSGDGVGGSSK